MKSSARNKEREADDTSGRTETEVDAADDTDVVGKALVAPRDALTQTEVAGEADARRSTRSSGHELLRSHVTMLRVVVRVCQDESWGYKK